jgi:diguanylate cyclase (GGDEF)-like protein
VARYLPTRARLAGLGLVIAAVTIIVLAIVVLVDLDREVKVHTEVIAAQRAKDQLHSLRSHVLELRSTARLGARTGDASAFRNIELRAEDVEAALARLQEVSASDATMPGLPDLSQSSRLLLMHARSVAEVRAMRGAASAAALAQETERLTQEATATVDRSLAVQTARVSERTLAQIALSERLRRYIAGLLVGSIVTLIGLFAAYRRAQVREREALRRIELLAHFDMLTGLPNRALLADRLAQEVSRARRSSRGFAVLLFDLDGFKSVNDTWGHSAGDRVLTIVGERARKCVRASDTVGRQGGDEFLAILPETGLEGALGVAEKLREALQEPYPLGEVEARLSASVGVALYPDHGSDPESLQRAADAALYRAKREGKNRIAVATGATRPGDAAGIAKSAA